MTVGPEFGEQEILDVATAAVDPCDQVVGRRQRPYPLIDAGPDQRLIVQHLVENGVEGRRFVFQPVLKLVAHELAVLLLLDQAFRYLSLMRGDRSEMLDAPDREAAYEQKNRQKRQPCELGRRIAKIDGRTE